MKKNNLLLACLCFALVTKAQTWNLTLNNVTGSPNFGTSNVKPINFFTSNTQRMSLSTTGKLQINDLSGTGFRFVQVGSDGTLGAWIGSSQDADKVLFGDNSWHALPFKTSGSTISIPTSGSKFGVGLETPTTELDVNGGAQVANGLRVGEGLYIGPSDNYGLIHYTPGVNGGPAVFSFGGGGTGHPNNPNPGVGYNPYSNGHGANNYSPDPTPNNNCVDGHLATTVNVFSDMLSVKKLSATSTLLGNINLGHNGVNAFIETQGTNTVNPAAGDLLINSECNRNIYAFSNGGSTFASGTDHVMSVAGRLNVTQNMQIGGGTSLNGFTYNTAALFVNAPSTTAAAGIRVFHGGGADAALKLIEVGAAKKVIAIHNGTSNTVDGPERFSVLGDGKTEITTTNADAFVVNDAAASNALKFKVTSDGNTYMGEGASTVSSKVVIAQGSKSQKALSLVDNSSLSSVTDFFSVYGNGYTEINISSPGTLPDQVNSIGRVFAIKDKSQPKDIFVIKQNGKVYAREVEISLATTFPDYVFHEGYKLKSLSELDNYIKTYNHLPGFEKGDYYEKNGINVNEMFIKQQEKIEELTLYILGLEKRLQALEK